MSQAQKKILGIVKDMIAEYNLQAVVRPQWANTGVIGIEAEGAFGELASVSYSFQDGNFTLSIYRTVDGRSVGVPSQPPRQGYYDHYLSYTDTIGFERFRAIFRTTLEQIQPKKPRQSRRKQADKPATAMPKLDPVKLGEAKAHIQALTALLKDASPNFEPREGETYAFQVEIEAAEKFLNG